MSNCPFLDVSNIFQIPRSAAVAGAVVAGQHPKLVGSAFVEPPKPVSAHRPHRKPVADTRVVEDSWNLLKITGSKVLGSCSLIPRFREELV